MKNILIPTDFSDCSRAAEDIGLKIAKMANAEIHFLHLLMTPVDWVDLPLEKEQRFPEVKKAIGHAKNELIALTKRAKDMGLRSREFLVFDKGREEIHDHIAHHNHDFIVMGSHGARGLKEVMGSNAQKIVRKSKIPVLVVKKPVKSWSINTIVFAATFEEDVIASFKKVIELGELTDARIHLLNVNTQFQFRETEDILSSMTDYMNLCASGRCTVNIYNALNEEKGILKFAESIDADIIVMTTHGKIGFINKIAPSLTEKLVNHSDIPVLSLNINLI